MKLRIYEAIPAHPLGTGSTPGKGNHILELDTDTLLWAKPCPQPLQPLPALHPSLNARTVNDSKNTRAFGGVSAFAFREGRQLCHLNTVQAMADLP